MNSSLRLFYYLDENNQQIGPFNEVRLLEMKRAGLIGEHTLIWTDGFEGWTHFVEVFPNSSEPTIKDKAKRYVSATTSALQCASSQLLNVVSKPQTPVRQHVGGFVALIKAHRVYAVLTLSLSLGCIAYFAMSGDVTESKETASDDSSYNQTTSYSANVDRSAFNEMIIARAQQIAQREEARRLEQRQKNERLANALRQGQLEMERKAYEQQRAAEKRQQEQYQIEVQRNLRNIDANLREQNRHMGAFYH